MDRSFTPRRAGTSGLLCLALLVAVVGCSDDPETGDPDTPTEIGDAVAIENPDLTSTTDPSEVTSSTTPPPPVGRPDAADAARFLYDAWGVDDRSLALTVAEPSAVEGMFSATPGPYELYRGCDTGEFDTGGCLFRDRTTNNTIQVNLERRDGNWVATGVVFSPG